MKSGTCCGNRTEKEHAKTRFQAKNEKKKPRSQDTASKNPDKSSTICEKKDE